MPCELKKEVKLDRVDRLHVLLRIALDDLQECEKDPKYEVSMGDWVRTRIHPHGDTCAVCLAGAVLARRHGWQATAGHRCAQSPPRWAHALDCLRAGQLDAAAHNMPSWSPYLQTDSGRLKAEWVGQGFDQSLSERDDYIPELEARYEWLKKHDL